MKENEKKNTRTAKIKKVLKVLGKIFLSLLILIILLLLFIRSPWGQNIIVNKVTSYVSDKTNTTVEIDKLFVTFSGNLSLNGLYLEDKKGDTLLYSKKLEAEIPLLPIIKGNPISIDDVDWQGLTANVYRKDSINGFNYSFLIDAFASDTTAAKPAKESGPPKISVGSINLKNFKVNYNDAVSGMDARLNLGELQVEGKDIDLEKMKFHLASIQLKNTNVNYQQLKPIESTDTTSTGNLPYILVDDFLVENLSAYYKAPPQGLEALAEIRNFKIKETKANLTAQEIEVANFGLKNSDISVVVDTTKMQKETVEKLPKKEEETFQWPEWEVNVTELALENNAICYKQKGVFPRKGEFNPNAIELSDFTLLAENIGLTKDGTANLEINKFRFYEASGFELKELTFAANLDKNKLRLSNLNLATQKSKLAANLQINFSSLEEFIEKPENAQFAAQLSNIRLNAQEAYIFAPQLRQNEMFAKLANQPISGRINVNGSLAKAEIKRMQLNWGKSTKINLRGFVSNPTQVEKLYLDINEFSASTTQDELAKFINPDSLGIAIPQNIELTGNFKGQMDDFTTNTSLTTTNGIVNVQGSFNQQGQIAFDSTIEIVELDLGQILQNEKLGKISLTLKTEGKGDNLNNLDATLNSEFSKLIYNKYDLSALKLSGKIKNGEGDVAMRFKDDNLNLDLDSHVKLDSVAPEVNATINVKGADLYTLGITKKKIRSKVKITADFKGNAEDFKLKTAINEGVVVYDNRPYYLGDVYLNANVDKDSTAVAVNSSFLNTTLNSNANPQKIGKALQQHVEHYFEKDTAFAQELENPVNLKLDLRFHDTPIISEVFLDGLERMDTLRANIAFNQAKHNLKADISLPYLEYNENIVDSLGIALNSDGKKANFDATFAAIEAGPAKLPQTKINSNFKDEQLYLNFESFTEKGKLYAIHSVLEGKDSKRIFKILPEELILNQEDWQINTANQIVFGEKQLDFSNFVLSQNTQQVEIKNFTERNAKDWGLEFDSFKLSSILAYLNPQEHLIEGNVNGEVVFENPFKKPGFTADLKINDFTIFNSKLGVLSLEAESQSNNTYVVDAGIKGEEVDIDFNGNYKTAAQTPSFDLSLDINKIALHAIEEFVPDQIKNTEGNLEGKIKLTGTSKEPNYKGYLAFNNAAFNVKRLDSKFRLAEERINIDNDGVYFSSFTIQDAGGNNFSIDGDILTESFTNPQFDLKLKAKDFTALNSDKEDNDLYYGKAVFDVAANITGDLNFPVVEATLTIREETNLTYVIPETQLSIEKRDGIVIFVNKENPDDILTRQDESKSAAVITGIELRTKLNIEPKATFNVIINEQTDDNLKIVGQGDLIFSIARNGRTTLTGKYDISGGHYQMNLYGLVKREFDLDPSSSVTWQGDPTNANLDVRAIYKVQTSASSLMASQTAGASVEVKNRYKQRLPFLVYLNVDGELMRPKLNFNLGMPEDERGAIGGSVYSRVRQLNQQEDQLNKQVFSLLVLNKFYPESGSDGSQGGIATMARDNLNDALSDQLNMFSDKLTGNTGIDLNFGVNSYTDYQGQTAQNRTDLAISAKKKLFNDRVVVQAGSEVNVQGDRRPGEANPVIGNVSIEYLLTENGRWRLKGFRKSEYENVIDGQVFVSGIALIFTREFNKFKELWDGSAKEEKKKEQEEKEQEEEKKENEKKEEETANNKAVTNKEDK